MRIVGASRKQILEPQKVRWHCDQAYTPNDEFDEIWDAVHMIMATSASIMVQLLEDPF